MKTTHLAPLAALVLVFIVGILAVSCAYFRVIVTTESLDSEYLEKINKEIKNAREKAKREKEQIELDARAQEEMKREVEIANQETENMAIRNKIYQKKVNGEYLSYSDAIEKYVKGHIVSAVGKFSKQIDPKTSIIMTHTEIICDYDIMKVRWVYNRVMDQPIAINNGAIFSVENELLELQLEFVGVVESMSASGPKIIPMFKLIDGVVIYEATEEQILRMMSQN